MEEIFGTLDMALVILKCKVNISLEVEVEKHTNDTQTSFNSRRRRELKRQLKFERSQTFQFLKREGKVHKLFTNSKGKLICDLDAILNGNIIDHYYKGILREIGFILGWMILQALWPF